MCKIRSSAEELRRKSSVRRAWCLGSFIHAGWAKRRDPTPKEQLTARNVATLIFGWWLAKFCNNEVYGCVRTRTGNYLGWPRWFFFVRCCHHEWFETVFLHSKPFWAGSLTWDETFTWAKEHERNTCIILLVPSICCNLSSLSPYLSSFVHKIDLVDAATTFALPFHSARRAIFGRRETNYPQISLRPEKRKKPISLSLLVLVCTDTSKDCKETPLRTLLQSLLFIPNDPEWFSLLRKLLPFVLNSVLCVGRGQIGVDTLAIGPFHIFISQIFSLFLEGGLLRERESRDSHLLWGTQNWPSGRWGGGEGGLGGDSVQLVTAHHSSISFHEISVQHLLT